MELFDSHSHPQFPAYDSGRGAVLMRAREAGVAGVLAVGTQYQTSEDALSLAKEHPGFVWATAGLHPSHAHPGSHFDSDELREPRFEPFRADDFRKLAELPEVVAIGECGLDYYRRQAKSSEAGSPGHSQSERSRGVVISEQARKEQERVFRDQIAIAKEAGKPLVIHCREAFPDLIRILSQERPHLTSRGNGIIHFFSGSWEDAKALLHLGFVLGFGGVITFARDYDGVLLNVPLPSLVLETDAPYVAPVPHRGKRNEPAYVGEVAKRIAELRNADLEEVARVTTANAKRLFGI